MLRTSPLKLATLMIVLSVAPKARAQYDLAWHTVDGGGGSSAAGAFSLVGTIGQHDAGLSPSVMIGGSFELAGGFWLAPSVTCVCLGDMNADGSRNGRDIQQFVQCVIAGGACACADVDGAAGLTNADVAMFVSDLLAGNACP